MADHTATTRLIALCFQMELCLFKIRFILTDTDGLMAEIDPLRSLLLFRFLRPSPLSYEMAPKTTMEDEK